MKKLLALTLLCNCFAFAALAAPVSSPGDDRIKLITYDETSVYTITTRYSYQTNIVFGPHEEIDTISVGDRSTWQIIPSGNRIFIRPMEEDMVTNMTVLTNKRSYQFDLKSLPAGKTEGNIYVAKFVYKDDKPRTTAEPAPATATAAAPFPPTAFKPYQPVAAPAPTPAPTPAPAVTNPAPVPLAGTAYPVHPNYNYTYTGPDAIAPLQVSDNGKSTSITFRDSSQPLPEVFIVEDGEEKPVSTSVMNGAMVVGAVAGELALKSDAGTVHVYNELLNPGN